MALVVKNPLSPAEHPAGLGVNCELFELGIEQFVVSGGMLDMACVSLIYFCRPPLSRIDPSSQRHRGLIRCPSSPKAADNAPLLLVRERVTSALETPC